MKKNNRITIIIAAILVVIAVMLMLFPLRTALVAATGLPVCTAICVGLMYLTGIELNTVTLAALIFVLGMIVDDSRTARRLRVQILLQTEYIVVNQSVRTFEDLRRRAVVTIEKYCLCRMVPLIEVN